MNNLQKKYTINRLIGDIYSDFRLKKKNLIVNILTSFFNANFQLLFLYRLGHFLARKGFTLFPNIIVYFQRIIFSCEISPWAFLGRNVVFPHPFAIGIGVSTVIDDNVRIHQLVIIGSPGKHIQSKIYPHICENVIIYSGSTIVGAVTIGKNSIIGASSFVNTNIPENTVTVMPSARMLPQNKK